MLNSYNLKNGKLWKSTPPDERKKRNQLSEYYSTTTRTYPMTQLTKTHAIIVDEHYIYVVKYETAALEFDI